MMRPTMPIAAALLLAACTKPDLPPPAIELRTVEVRVPVPQPCLPAAQIPAEPERIAGKLTGDARHDLDLVAANAIRLRAWGQGMKVALEACAR